MAQQRSDDSVVRCWAVETVARSQAEQPMVEMAMTSLVAVTLDFRFCDRLATTSCCCLSQPLRLATLLVDAPSSSSSDSDIALPSSDFDVAAVAVAQFDRCSSSSSSTSIVACRSQIVMLV